MSVVSVNTDKWWINSVSYGGPILGDASAILSRIQDEGTIRAAFRYAISDRYDSDAYYDPIEIEELKKREDQVVQDLVRDLDGHEEYDPRRAYAYFIPKNDLVNRRMIYIPLKDLVVRYAICIVIADLIDDTLSDRCFANRRATGESRNERFLEDFAKDAWPRWCNWQRECANDDSSWNVLVKTDISAFFDSVSHEYLISEIAESLGITQDSDPLQLLKVLLKIPVVSYSHLKSCSVGPETVHQGLAIGNETEGFLANLLLKSVDDAMEEVSGIEFGRYNDDMRIFSEDVETAQKALTILQERLLKKGLNLNVSKTEIAIGDEEMENLRSKTYEGYGYKGQREDNDDASQGGDGADLPVEDIPFDEFDREFEPGEPLVDPDDPSDDASDNASDFCRFLTNVLGIEDRVPEHVETLREILDNYPGCSRHAAWCLVQTFAWDNVPEAARERAEERIMELLEDPSVSTYGRYRILHHLFRPRDKSRYFERLSDRNRDRLEAVLQESVSELSFALNVISLYGLSVMGTETDDLRGLVKNSSPDPGALPVRQVLIRLSEGESTHSSVEIREDPSGLSEAGYRY